MQPLADKLRPTKLQDYIGQTELVGENGVIKKMVDSKKIVSMVLWGPPASGKTTLARIIAAEIEADLITISAVMQGKEELKKAIATAQTNKSYGKDTILFIDEIHRWNKAQQDALLPYVENGSLILIGATTENPSFSIISALLSRLRVFVLNPHSKKELLIGLKRGLIELKGKTTGPSKGETEVMDKICWLADGDMRYGLNVLELTWSLGNDTLKTENIDKAAQRSLQFDQNGEQFYNLISAVHKSLRSSNPTAGVYWIVRILEAGGDPLYIARRLVRFASEDIGNANPNALLLANQVYTACQNLGMPECAVHLVQLGEYLANSVKSNKSYMAYAQAKADISKHGSLPVPMHFRNAPTALMKELGYGKDYQYDHDLEGKSSDQQCLPDELIDRDYFK